MSEHTFNVIFVTFEVDHTVSTFVSTTLVTYSDFITAVRPALFLMIPTKFSGVDFVISLKS